MSEAQVMVSGRLSFPSLFTAKAFTPGGEKKYEATILIPRGHACIELVKDAMQFVIEDEWKGKKPKGLKLGLRDGAEKPDLEGYGEDVMFIPARNKDRPTIVDRGRMPVTEDDNLFYPGCWVNALLGAWAQDNQYGKRVNFNLLAVQFVKNDEAFGAGAPAPPTVFDAIEDEEEETEDLDNLIG